MWLGEDTRCERSGVCVAVCAGRDVCGSGTNQDARIVVCVWLFVLERDLIWLENCNERHGLRKNEYRFGAAYGIYVYLDGS